MEIAAYRFALRAGREIQVRHTLYVDDLTIEADGERPLMAKTLGQATDSAIAYVEQVLRLVVSKSKSPVVTETVLTAAAVSDHLLSSGLSFKSAAKMLGTACSGGKRRCPALLHDRLTAFVNRRTLFGKVRNAGVDTARMAQAAGTSSYFYGADTTGVAEQHLLRARRANARVASGKDRLNVDVHYMAADAAGSKSDPAFEAHKLPVKSLALAVWQDWRPRGELSKMIISATLAVAKEDSRWQHAEGPIAAAVLTLHRLRWRFVAPLVLITDCNVRVDLRRDSPAAVMSHVEEAVRNWRAARILRAHPAAMPERLSWTAKRRSDTAGSRHLPEGVHHAEGAYAAALHTARGATKQFRGWKPEHAKHAVSAMTGRQWPQTRLLKAYPELETDRCQLCFQAAGTLAHRRLCPANEPAGGWPEATQNAAEAMKWFAPKRAGALMSQGIAFLAADVPEPRGLDECWWVRQPDDENWWHETSWYVDGSLIDGPARLSARLGIGIVIVGRKGRHGRSATTVGRHDTCS